MAIKMVLFLKWKGSQLWAHHGRLGALRVWAETGLFFLRQALKPYLRVVSGIGGCAGCTHWLLVSSWARLLWAYSANALMKLDKWISGSETPSASSKEKHQPAKRLTFVYWGRGCVNALPPPRGQDSDKLSTLTTSLCATIDQQNKWIASLFLNCRHHRESATCAATKNNVLCGAESSK